MSGDRPWPAPTEVHRDRLGHAEAPCQRVPLGPYERRVHHRPVAGHVQRVLAAQLQEPVQGGLPAGGDRVGARLGFAGLLDQVPAEHDPGAAVRGPGDQDGQVVARVPRAHVRQEHPDVAAQVERPLAGDVVVGAYEEVGGLGGVRRGRPWCTASARRASHAPVGTPSTPIAPKTSTPVNAAAPKTWSKWGWVSARCVTRAPPSSRRASVRNRAPSGRLEPASIMRAEPSPTTSPTVQSQPGRRHRPTRGVNPCHPHSSQVTVMRRR